MRKKNGLALMITVISCMMLAGSYSAAFAAETEAAAETETAAVQEAEEEGILEDGLYTAKFQSDSSMFHVNEANEGLGILTVKDGEMIFHASLASKSIVNLFPGLAEDAKKEGAQLLEPTEDTVTYSDGLSETVYGFDIPVPALDEEFDLALLGKKGKWYDHKVSVSDPKPATEEDLEKLTATVETEETES